MARMRTLKPEAATSETLTTVPRSVRWTFGLLWTHCDDEGRAALNVKLIKAALYPLEDDVTPDVLLEDIDQLEQIGALCVYEVDGKQYVHVPAWHDHQHPNRKVASRLPACPGGEGSDHVQQSRPEDSFGTDEHLTHNSVSTHERLTPVVVVEGRGDVDGDGGGEGENNSWSDELTETRRRRDLTRGFDEFWAAYPKRVAKQAALRKWKTLIGSGTDPERIIIGARAYALEVRGRDRGHVKNPDGWLNAGRWEDEAPAQPIGNSASNWWNN